MRLTKEMYRYLKMEFGAILIIYLIPNAYKACLKYFVKLFSTVIVFCCLLGHFSFLA